ncbi:hypothetical protein GW17_00023269 [Ensete ventricosum]|nr:hypothetical protein GW17_00023269 [Ensete ventricosum]
MSGISFLLFLGCSSRRMFASKRRIAAVVSIQKHVRRWLLRRTFLQVCSAVVVIQSSIRSSIDQQRYMSLKEHRAVVLIQVFFLIMLILYLIKDFDISFAANEAGALREAKSKLEKRLEDLSWRLALEKKLRFASEESKMLEISKLQKALDLKSADLDMAKSATAIECNKNEILQNQLNSTVKEMEAIKISLNAMTELKKENLNLQVWLSYFMQMTYKETSDLIVFLLFLYADTYPSTKEVGRVRGSGGKRWTKRGSEGSSDKDEDVMRKLETPPTKYLIPLPQSLSVSRRTRRGVERHEVDNEHDNLPYWLSNSSALLCLLQRNLRSNGFLATPRRTSWHELNYIRQAVGFLIIHQKRKKTLEEIRQDLCPLDQALSLRQIYRICTMYWDDKYSTHSVSNEVCCIDSVSFT